MPIRVTGLNSGLDTDSIIQELVSAYRTKGDKIKKKQIKLSWTQDKWKSLNAKVLNLYKSLDKMRFSAGYNIKKTTVSNTSKATVTASKDAVNGTQTLKIKTLAKGGYLSGAQLKKAKSGSTKLSELGFTDDGTPATYCIEGKNGVRKEINVDGNTTISDFVKQINNSGTGVTASYDNTNKRIYITSKDTGEGNDFMLTGLNTKGAEALNALGVNVPSKTSSAEAAAWMEYYNPVTGSVDRTKLEADVTAVAQAKQEQVDLTENIGKWQAENTQSAEAIKYVEAYKNAYAIAQKGINNPQDAADLSQFYNMSEEDRKKDYVRGDDGKLRLAEDGDDPNDYIKFDTLKNKYNIDETQPKLDEDGKPVLDDDGNPVEETSDIVKQLKAYNSHQAFRKEYEAEPTAEQQAVLDKVSAAISSGNPAAAYDDLTTEFNQNIEANKENIKNANTGLAKAAEVIASYKTINSSALTKEMSDLTDPDNKQAFDDYVNTLAERVEFFATNYTKVGDDYELTQNVSGGKKVDATDAVIELNGVEYTSNTNTFNINGMTIQAHETTGMDDDDAITLTTSTDTQGLYDKIKDFITEYNAIIGEMSSLYNAESSKGYEPLTSEEKEVMSESEIADWEKKIKDSVLRRDSTLGGLISTMTSAMSASVKINGKNYSLSSLGIKTGNYFGTSAADRYMYHIDGDADDDETSANADKLMAMLNSDPDTVIEIIKGASQKLYEGLNKKMGTTSLSSFQSIYNDKSMAQSYSDYTKKISAWEEKVAKIEDDYYKKFAAMETALSKLQSQQSALAGLLGS